MHGQIKDESYTDSATKMRLEEGNRNNTKLKEIYSEVTSAGRDAQRKASEAETGGHDEELLLGASTGFLEEEACAVDLGRVSRG